MLDIPPWYHDRKSYNASLGHMVNNRFAPFTNAKFGAMEHPRFGPIETVVATRHIEKGEEFFIDYGYKVPCELCHWYEDQQKLTQEYLRKKMAGENVSHLPIP